MGLSIKEVCIFNGHKGCNLDGFSPMKLVGFNRFINNYQDSLFEIDDNSRIDKYEVMSLDEIKKKAANFCKDYLSVDDIYFLDSFTKEQEYRLNHMTSIEDFCTYLNSILKKISIFDLPITLVSNNFMYGLVNQPCFKLNDLLNYKDRKPFFSDIELGSDLSNLSVAILVHEYMHLLEQKNIGYADDYNNIEFLSIFIEKVVASLISQDALEIIERTRLLYLVDSFLTYFSSKDEEKKQENICYIKSTLLAIKYFDMFMSERKPKDKDRYFDEINKVLEGKIKVEEIIAKRELTITKCQDMNTLLRHSYIK